MSVYAWLQNMKTKRENRAKREEEDYQRQKSLEDMQMRMMESEMAANQRQNQAAQSTAESAAPMAKKYMDMWQGALQKSTGMFNKALANVDKGWDAISKMQDNQLDFTQLHKDMEDDWNKTKDKYGGLADQAIEQAGEEMVQRRELGKNLTSLAQPDYEGAAGRAMADVTGESERQRQAEQRRMAGFGVDPTSGRSRSAMNTIARDETLAKATAAGQARRGEKERVTNVTTDAMRLIDPSKTARMATDVQQAKTNMMGQRVNLAEAEAGLRGRMASTIGNMASTTGGIARAYGDTVTAPIGEAAGVFSGMASQGGYNPITGKAAAGREKSVIEKAYDAAKGEGAFMKRYGHVK